MDQPPGLPARQAALKVLDAALRRGETVDHAARSACRGLPLTDAALARAIAAEVLRWLVDLDALIDGATQRALPSDAKARMALRIMLAQALRLETPPHAVIATGLPLLAGGPRRLAHGVFSTLVRDGAVLPAAPALPEAVVARWAYRSSGELDAIASGLAEPPPLDLTLREPAETDLWTERLGAQVMAPGLLRLPRGTAIENMAGFQEGAWWVQDLAAAIPARLLGAGAGRAALDLCAAPGGKTMQLAAAGWEVTALDISKRRLERLTANCERTGLSARVVRADALDWHADREYDAILLDAPCTASGTCRRHPEVLHRIGAHQIAEFAEQQSRLLARATNWLKPGGRLVYAVCSLEREEGEAIASGAADLAIDPITAAELPFGLEPTADGFLRTTPAMLPEQGGLDGFFIARFTT